MEEIKNMVQAKVNHLKNVKKSVEQSLKQAPKGSLVVSHSHGNEQYYYKTDLHEKKGVYTVSYTHLTLPTMAVV